MHRMKPEDVPSQAILDWIAGGCLIPGPDECRPGDLVLGSAWNHGWDDRSHLDIRDPFVVSRIDGYVGSWGEGPGSDFRCPALYDPDDRILRLLPRMVLGALNVRRP